VFAEEAGLQLALATQLTPQLEREGMARDFVRHVQQFRKDADLEIEERIVVQFDCDDAEIARALEEWHDYITKETLAESLAPASAGEGWKSVRIGPGSLRVSIERVEAESLGRRGS
jgi:isoleucyl-tRNA synthetase